MKKMLSLLLVFTLVLSMATSAFAAEGWMMRAWLR